MKLLLNLLNTLFLTGCSVFGVMSVEEAGYDVVKENGRIQVRQYKPMVVAQTEVDANYDEASNKAFNRLFNYISGKNKKQQKISMSAPVIMDPKAEEVAMTAPVFQEKSGKLWLMQFVLPSDYTLATAPIPDDPSISLKEIPSKKVAVLRYSGFLSEQSIAEKTKELQSWLDEEGFKAISSARSAGFDPPWTLPFLRRNEIHIDID
jgi:effector-binding domain-containing protein